MNNNALKILSEIPDDVQLVAVTKKRSIDEILDVYHSGIRDFGENRVQELLLKQPYLPSDIRWHLIGHLQTNKVKYIASFIHLIQSVDSIKLLIEINNQAKRHNRVIDCLLQVYIAEEETKFGLDAGEIESILSSSELNDLQNIRIIGLMGMATYTDDLNQVRNEFHYLKSLFGQIKATHFPTQDYFSQISMGMSSDYLIAIEEGSTIVRIGTALFGERG